MKQDDDEGREAKSLRRPDCGGRPLCLRGEDTGYERSCRSSGQG